MSPDGVEQQISKLPAAGGSSGSGSYWTVPPINAHSQVWQTPVRHDHRRGTSQASASSSKLENRESHETVSPLRINEICGPIPGSPAGGCPGGREDRAIPGVIGASGPNTSV